MKTAQIILEMFRRYGVDTVFGLPGETTLPLYDAWRSYPDLRHVMARDERSSVFMAHGYARVSGRPGVCEGPSGGGATYLLPGLVEANESSVAVLGITSDDRRIRVRTPNRSGEVFLPAGEVSRRCLSSGSHCAG